MLVDTEDANDWEAVFVVSLTESRAEDRAVVREGAVGAVAAEVFIAAARECPERAIIVEVDGAGGGQES